MSKRNYTLRRIAFFIPDLRGGGAEKAVCNLLKELAGRGMLLDLVLCHATGVHLKEVPSQVRIIDLDKRRMLSAIFDLAAYIKKNNPSVLIANLSHANVIALLAKRISGTKVPVIAVEHIVPASVLSLKERFVHRLARWLYPDAAGIVAVANGTSRQIEKMLGLPVGKVRSIYNPVVTPELKAKAAGPFSGPWPANSDLSCMLAAGRFVDQKDFGTLLKAFALVRQQRPVKLTILGEGVLRRVLEDQIQALGIAEDVAMPGFVDNPYAYMAHSDLFVLSSRWEGLGNVLIEALACGCSIVSTDCPSGPSEILEDGRWGILVPVGDAAIMANAILHALDHPLPAETLKERGYWFSAERAADAYLALIEEVTDKEAINAKA